MVRLVFKITLALAFVGTIVAASIKAEREIAVNAFDNNVVVSSFKEPSKLSKLNTYTSKGLAAKDIDIVEGLNLYYENKAIPAAYSVLSKNNRYYLSIMDFEKLLGYSIKIYEDKVYVYKDNRNIVIDLKNNSYKVYFEKDLKNPCIVYRNEVYLSVIDLVNIFDLKTKWNYEKKELRFYDNRDTLPKETRTKFKRPALIRLEDVSAGTVYLNRDSLEKLRILSDFMYSKDVPFHVAWIPRYVNPKEGVDNDLLKVNSMVNADFIFSLDYLSTRGGIIGLHGYTHQYGDGESIVDSEFGDKWCKTPEETKQRVEAAINVAKELNIPYSFFESPHYRSTPEQQEIFEKYFDYMYEPSKRLYNRRPALSKANSKTVYVPAPLGYVHDKEIEDMINRLKTKPRDSIASLFYHPTKEFEYITLTEKNGYPTYEYSENSILHKLLKAFSDQGYTPVKITDIKIKK